MREARGTHRYKAEDVVLYVFVFILCLFFVSMCLFVALVSMLVCLIKRLCLCLFSFLIQIFDTTVAFCLCRLF